MANINKNIIMQAGAAVANAANKAAGLSASTPEPGTIISVIQLVNGGRTIGPEALAHFTESVRNKLLSLLVGFEPIQDMNGYDHPWPGGGGKNILNPKLYNGGTYNPSVGTTWTLTESAKQFSTTNNKTFTIQTTAEWESYIILIPITGLEHVKISYELSSTSTLRKSQGYLDSSYKVLYNSSSTDTHVTADQQWNPGSNPNAAYIYILISNGGTASATITLTDPQCENGTTTTSYEPYENICPISGRTGLSVYVGPTSAIGDAETHSMAWTSPAGTVYAGSADIVTGDIKAAPYYASYNGETLVGPWVSSMDVYDPEGTPTTGAQVVDLGGAMTEYHITGQDIITLVGDNYIWSDSGDVTITE